MTEAARFTDPSEDDQSLTTQQLEALLDLQCQILGEANVGEDHKNVLEHLIQAAEKLVPRAVGSIMLYKESQQQLQVYSAPNLSREAIEALNGLKLGSGSCGNAIYHEEPMYVCNTLTDARWENVIEFAKRFSVGACWSHPIFSRKGKPIGTFALSSFTERQPSKNDRKVLETCANIAGIILQREEYLKELRHLAQHDTLTGLFNRRSFCQNAELQLKKSTRSGEHMALLFIDIDNFKSINDRYGHETGDKVICSLARSLQSNSREGDFLCRWGGDEFLILMSCLDQCESDVNAMLARNIKALHKSVVIAGQHIPVETSVGVAMFPNDATQISELINLADRAMLNAKTHGRNQIVFHKP
ncbi:MAG: sensor domain-containing diguanylate cyclase [bacterium]